MACTVVTLRFFFSAILERIYWFLDLMSSLLAFFFLVRLYLLHCRIKAEAWRNGIFPELAFEKPGSELVLEQARPHWFQNVVLVAIFLVFDHFSLVQSSRSEWFVSTAGILKQCAVLYMGVVWPQYQLLLCSLSLSVWVNNKSRLKFLPKNFK